MKKILSTIYLITGYLILAYVLRNMSLEVICLSILGILFITSGIFYVISDYNIHQLSWFHKRTGFLYLLFLIPIPFFIFLFRTLLPV